MNFAAGFSVVGGGLFWLLASWHQLWRLYPPATVVPFSLSGLVWGSLILATFYFGFWPLAIISIFLASLFYHHWFRHQDWIFFETWEKLTPVLLLLLLWFLINLVFLVHLLWARWLVLVLSLIFISNLYWRRYRSFSWYRSGKIGFLPLMNSALISLSFALVFISQHDYFWALLGFFLGVGFLGLLYLLSLDKLGKLWQ